MKFKEVLGQVIEWLQQDRRISYRTLTRQFDLDDDYLDDLKEAILFTYLQASDKEGQGLVWTEAPSSPLPDTQPETDKENASLSWLTSNVTIPASALCVIRPCGMIIRNPEI